MLDYTSPIVDTRPYGFLLLILSLSLSKHHATVKAPVSRARPWITESTVRPSCPSPPRMGGGRRRRRLFSVPAADRRMHHPYSGDFDWRREFHSWPTNPLIPLPRECNPNWVRYLGFCSSLFLSFLSIFSFFHPDPYVIRDFGLLDIDYC